MNNDLWDVKSDSDLVKLLSNQIPDMSRERIEFIVAQDKARVDSPKEKEHKYWLYTNHHTRQQCVVTGVKLKKGKVLASDTYEVLQSIEPIDYDEAREVMQRNSILHHSAPMPMLVAEYEAWYSDPQIRPMEFAFMAEAVRFANS